MTHFVRHQLSVRLCKVFFVAKHQKSFAITKPQATHALRKPYKNKPPVKTLRKYA
ncbi:hypothetical protein HMPREF3232_00045 [Fannyhessea vaginae]|nr:hypothetical protein HMPREF3232_00045 [Fannyhessea vaginae]